ncbi:unnamed protein product, partial [marine sediment metagenome]
IEGFYRKLAIHLGFEYWGFVMEYLNVSSQSIAQMFDIDLNKYVVDINSLKKLIPKSLNIPFFIITSFFFSLIRLSK